MGLGWRAGSVVAMTWIYFDESGEHSLEDGRLRRLTLGCGVSTLEGWNNLEKEWRAVIEDAGVVAFHMADFESRARPFDTWDDTKRKYVLNSLLDIAIK